MLFNSLEYLIFLPIVIIIYYLLPGRFRWVLLLVASYYFYMSWKPEYIILIAGSSLLDYYLAKGIARTNNKKNKKLLLVTSLVVNLGVLFSFKYLNFFSENINAFFQVWGVQAFVPYYDLILPVGISFYTFQTLSYTIDVYQNKISPATHLGKFMVFVSFFPQLVAGPIERSRHLLPQFDKQINFNPTDFTHGLRQILWGFFKKVVVADRLAIVVNAVYADTQTENGFIWLFVTFLFAFQIYCDFSGYSDIAIGSARLLGIDLMDNFRMPYFSKSLREFWSRWHISLSTWFRDYVYYPLGGNQLSSFRTYVNLMIVFVVSGLWHGANWTFILWGGWHGLLLILEKIYHKTRLSNINYFGRSVLSTLAMPLTFLLVLAGWVFFRAQNISQAGYIFNQIFNPTTWSGIVPAWQEMLNLASISGYKVALSIYFLFMLILLEWLSRDKSYPVIYSYPSRPLRWVSYYTTLFAIILFGNSANVEFIYFQF